MEEKSFKSFYIIIRAQNYIDVFSMIKNINIYVYIYRYCGIITNIGHS